MKKEKTVTNWMIDYDLLTSGGYAFRNGFRFIAITFNIIFIIIICEC